MADLPKPENNPALSALNLVEREGALRQRQQAHFWQSPNFLRWSSFIALVVGPVFFVCLYMAAIAQDQYHSDVAFVVRSAEGRSGANDILGALAGSSSDSVTDGLILFHYIHSQDMVDWISKKLDIREKYKQTGADWYFSLPEDGPIEDVLDYWRSMVSVKIDNSSGILHLEVRAFTPDDARLIATLILQRSRQLVNELSETARNDAVKFAIKQVADSEERLKKLQIDLLNYRQTERVVDPQSNVESTLQILATLNGELVRLETEYQSKSELLDADSLQMNLLKLKIDSVRDQIEKLKESIVAIESDVDGKIAVGGKTLIDQIRQFEILKIEASFAQEAYTASRKNLEIAQAHANNEQRYLAVFGQPSLSDLAQYPKRSTVTFLFMLAMLGGWLVIYFVITNIRDRQ
jgi:capsular polysaccharide transport system permease protein